MEIRWKSKDIPSWIKSYYKKLEGMNVEVEMVTNSKNVDETFKVIYRFNQEDGKAIEKFIPANEIILMLRQLLSSFGFVVEDIVTNFGGKNQLKEGSTTETEYIPYFQSITAECHLADSLEKTIQKH